MLIILLRNPRNEIHKYQQSFKLDMAPSVTISDKDLRKYVKENPLDEVALTSVVLGLLLGISLTVLPWLKFKPIAFYLISLSVFHFLEFYITARYNTSKVNKDSFLINNGFSYILAHLIALTEAYLEFLIFPNFKKSMISLKILGVLFIIVGQTVRSMAMVTAGQSFSHIVQQDKKNDHVLVKNGVYSISRHPSYAGFFYWALGTELLLLNPIGFCGFFIALWYFFDKRVRFEEQYLVAFFGDDYINYRKTTRTWIPYI